MALSTSSRFRALVLPVLLGLALLVPGNAAAQGTIAVYGKATLEVPNDTASLGFGVAKERGSRAEALRVVSARLREVIAAVQTIPGVGPGDVTTGQISVRKVTRGKRTLWRASESISVVLHQPDRAGEVVSAAIAAGATGTSGPRFFPGNPEAAYDSALIAAFDQAKAKAQSLASRAGAVLGPAQSIEEGSEAVPGRPMAREVTAGAEPTPPTKPGTSTVTATVRVVFTLQ